MSRSGDGVVRKRVIVNGQVQRVGFRRPDDEPSGAPGSQTRRSPE